MENSKLLMEIYMKSFRALLAVFVLMISCGCSKYSDINGNVVDSVTGKPIEGAVVVAQWTKTCGIPGMQYHELHKITETLTDKDGAFALSGTSGAFIDPPEMIIYKEGYLPWRNDLIFPGGQDSLTKNLTKNHEWFNNMKYKLENFPDKYTFEQLSDFLGNGMMLSIGRSELSSFTDIFHKVSDKKENELRIKKAKDK